MEIEGDEAQAVLNRLARVHKVWRANRPAIAPRPRPSPEERLAQVHKAMDKVQSPEPKDVVAIREVQNDPVATEIESQLGILGWQLYAKDGADLLHKIYAIIERDHHPGFVFAVRRAWRDIGFPNDPRGVWPR